MKFSVSVPFFCDGTGRDKRTDIGTDRLFSENVILDVFHWSLFYCLGGTCSMTKFYKRQQLLKFRCLCDFCKHGENTDIKAYEEFERLNQEREKIALEKGLYNNFGANFCFLLI